MDDVKEDREAQKRKAEVEASPSGVKMANLLAVKICQAVQGWPSSDRQRHAVMCLLLEDLRSYDRRILANIEHGLPHSDAATD